eukprot:1909668-Alexandrium_andersonii.AAC.1
MPVRTLHFGRHAVLRAQGTMPPHSQDLSARPMPIACPRLPFKLSVVAASRSPFKPQFSGHD